MVFRAGRVSPQETTLELSPIRVPAGGPSKVAVWLQLPGDIPADGEVEVVKIWLRWNSMVFVLSMSWVRPPGFSLDACREARSARLPTKWRSHVGMELSHDKWAMWILRHPGARPTLASIAPPGSDPSSAQKSSVRHITASGDSREDRS